MSAEKNTTIYAMSRRRRATILTLCALAAFVFIWFDHSSIRRKWQSCPITEEQVKNCDFKKYHTKTFIVVNIVDGDTIDIDVPDGQDNHTRIRFWGIDTPETKHPKTGVMYFGPEAADFTAKSALGKKVRVYLDEANQTRGKYGRVLAYVQLPNGRFLNEVLLTEGFAYADSRFRHSFYHKYKQLEASAHRRKKGLWEKVTHEQLPKWRRNSNIKMQNLK